MMDEDSDDGDLHRPLTVSFWRKFTWRRGISGGMYVYVCVSTETLAGAGAAINPLKG